MVLIKNEALVDDSFFTSANEAVAKYPLELFFNHAVNVKQTDGQTVSVMDQTLFTFWLFSFSRTKSKAVDFINDRLADFVDNGCVSVKNVAKYINIIVSNFIRSEFKLDINSERSDDINYITFLIDLAYPANIKAGRLDSVLVIPDDNTLIEECRYREHRLLWSLDRCFMQKLIPNFLSALNPKYKDSGTHDPIAFLKEVYGEEISLGRLSLSNIHAIDQPLWKALHNWANRTGNDLSVHIPIAKTKPGPVKGETLGRPRPIGAGRKTGTKLPLSAEEAEAEANRKRALRTASTRRYRAKKALTPK